MKITKNLSAAMIKLLYFAGNIFLEMARRCLWPRGIPNKKKRICIYRIGNIGDIICALPAMYSIRQAYPESHLTLLTSPGKRGMIGALDLVAGAKWLDNIIVYYKDEIDTFKKKFAFFEKLREQSFDIWLELPNDLITIRASLRNMLTARAIGCRWGYGWRLSTIRFAAQIQSKYFHFPNEVERLLAIIRKIGISTNEIRFPLPIKKKHISTSNEILKRYSLIDTPLFAIAPGAKRSTNRWPPARFAIVARHLIQKGFHIILLGGRSDHDLCQRLAKATGKGCLNLAGKSSLLESAILLQKCRFLICNDSGIQHLASSVRVPCISLFSFWQLKGKWHPYGTKNIVLQKWTDCHTCFLETCPHDNLCLNLISEEEVIQAVDEKISEI